MTERLLDARGLRCPWPALRLARLMREIGAGETVRMITDDAKAEAEISGLAEINGWPIAKLKTAENCVFTVSRHAPQ
jgi:tRNA 2-thiouridine synthesizing protein A